MMTVAAQAACEGIDPDYATRGPAVERLMAKWAHCLPPDPAKWMEQTRQQVNGPRSSQTPAQKDEIKRQCAEQSPEIAALLAPKSALYATPKATWQEFRSALIAKDRKRALRCLAAGNQYVEALNAMPDGYLPTFGSSLSDIKETDKQSDDYREAYAETTGPDGKKSGAFVLFAKINDNWYIGSL